MTPTTDLGLRPIPVAPDQPLRSHLLVDGEACGTVLDGVELEAQFALGSERLVLITHDCPFEEGLELILLDERLGIVDRISLGWMYTPGILHVLLSTNDTVEFEFFGGDRWRLTVLALPQRMRLTPDGVSMRPWRWWLRKRRFRIERLA